MILLNWGCTEVIELDIEQVQPVYVIEGMVTNQYDHHQVRITKSVGFYEEGPAIVYRRSGTGLYQGDSEYRS